MLPRPGKSILALTMVLGLFVLSCVIEENLRLSSDGSGSYHVRIAIPKELGDLNELKQEAEKNGFRVEQEGETDKERFLAVRKEFADVTALNDSSMHFEFTRTEAGFLRREYHLTAQLQPVGFGVYTRRLIVTMPGTIRAATAGEVSGDHVTWDASRGGTIEITASGFYLPFNRNAKLSLIVFLLGAVVFVAWRRRMGRTATACPACKQPIVTNARFCARCGATNPLPET